VANSEADTEALDCPESEGILDTDRGGDPETLGLASGLEETELELVSLYVNVPHAVVLCVAVVEAIPEDV
jgi:hypothetical protein